MEYGLANTYFDMEHRGISIVRCHFKANCCLSLQNGSVVGIDDSKFNSEAEQNTAAIHEDGHFISGSFYVPFSPYQIKEQAEYRADKAAIMEHIPYEELRILLRRGHQLDEIAEWFCVTEQYALKAYLLYRDLGYRFCTGSASYEQ